MKKRLLIFLFIFFISTSYGGKGIGEVKFDDYFVSKTMRIDLYQTGTKTKEIISLDKIKEEPIWAGSLVNLIDEMNLGHHIARVYDLETGKLIYSRGFSSVFAEWQTTDEAAEEIYRTFSISVLIPYPKNRIRFTISSRNKDFDFVEVFSTEIDPNSRFINREKPDINYKPKAFWESGPPNIKLDILILPEGYTKSSMKNFKKDLKRLANFLLSTSPFRENKDKINIWYLEVPSAESGIDNPREGVFVNTTFDLSFNTFDTDRYVQSPNNKTMRDIAANAPYDQIYILFNSCKYGGGGIFNFCSCCYNHEEEEEKAWWPEYVFTHEFGHAFAGLADEYYSSSVAYNEFYPEGVEPPEPNVTALLDLDNLKWKELVEPGIPIPTPWDKDEYDKLFDPKEKEEFLRKQKYWGKVGAFEGAGYSSEGLYRPFLDCRMFSKSLTEFCPVCSTAIVEMINFYAE